MPSSRIVVIRSQFQERATSEAEALTVLSTAEAALPRDDVLIDHRLYSEDIEGGVWADVHAYIRERAALAKQKADEGGDAALVHVGLGEVPCLIALGAYLGDERLVRTHDYHRDRDSWQWNGLGPTLPVTIVNPPRELVTQSGEVVVRIEVSGIVSDEEVDEVVDRDRLADVTIRPLDGRAIPGRVQSPEDVAGVREALREVIGALRVARPNAALMHLFVAAPVSVCLAVGQELRLRNGLPVQTYRYRRVPGVPAYSRALLLSTAAPAESERPLSREEIALAGELRVRWGGALATLQKYAVKMVERAGDVGPRAEWYEHLAAAGMLASVAPFRGLHPVWTLIGTGHSVSSTPRPSAYAFDKDDGAGTWHLSDHLILAFHRAAGGDVLQEEEAMRLFFLHEYLHDWQDLTKYTADDVGSFANCLERIDYIADASALLHQVDFVERMTPERFSTEEGKKEYLSDQIDLLIRTFFAFEPAPPHFEWQERRVRRYLNWLWRRVQVQRSPTLGVALQALARQPAIEVAGFRYTTGGGRVFVCLNTPRKGDVVEIGLVLEDGRFFRRGSSTDLSIEKMMDALGNHDKKELRRFFNSLFEHVNQTNGAFPVN